MKLRTSFGPKLWTRRDQLPRWPCPYPKRPARVPKPKSVPAPRSESIYVQSEWCLRCRDWVGPNLWEDHVASHAHDDSVRELINAVLAEREQRQAWAKRRTNHNRSLDLEFDSQ